MEVVAGVALSTVPCDLLWRIEPQLFRVLLLRRLRLPSPLLCVFAGVAVHSTPLALTAPVPELGFLEEVLPLRRECAVRRGHASRRTLLFVIWIWKLLRREVVGDLRWWRMACHFMEGLRLLSTPRWCRRCIVAEVPLVVPPSRQGLHWQLPDVTRSAHTRN